MFSLKKIKFFFSKYNSTINTNSWYFMLPLHYLEIVKFFYSHQVIFFYSILNQNIYIYLPPKNGKMQPYKKFCNKHQKIYHTKKNLGTLNLYLTSFGLVYGKKAKQFNSGGRLLYTS